MKQFVTPKSWHLQQIRAYAGSANINEFWFQQPTTPDPQPTCSHGDESSA
ncbi:hypothetical protein H6G89_13235 [Oscillatoria sp. FACHB-1407]|nr:hypothetical protein [Oscillatoria sp. FACHB-1407]MBD2462012.1 hypothetical protein [Oscillatoria sp. FACHB-1407]